MSTLQRLKESLGVDSDISRLISNNDPGIDSITEVYQALYDLHQQSASAIEELELAISNLSGGTGLSSGGTISSSDIINALGYTPYNNDNPSNFINETYLSPFIKATDANNQFYSNTNPNNYISSIDSSNVTTALGYTPVSETKTVTINGDTQTIGSNPNFTVSGSVPPGTMVLLYADEVDSTGNGSQFSVKSYTVPANSYSLIMTEAEVSFNGAANADNELSYRLMKGTTINREFRLKQDATGTGDTWILGGSLKFSESMTAGGAVDIDVIGVNGAVYTWTVHSFRVFGIV